MRYYTILKYAKLYYTILYFATLYPDIPTPSWAQALNCPTYPKIIKRPMDLGTVSTKARGNTTTTNLGAVARRHAERAPCSLPRAFPRLTPPSARAVA